MSLQPRKPLAERWKRTWDDPCLLQRWWNVSCPSRKFLGVLNEWLDQFGGGVTKMAGGLPQSYMCRMIVFVEVVEVVDVVDVVVVLVTVDLTFSSKLKCYGWNCASPVLPQ